MIHPRRYALLLLGSLVACGPAGTTASRSPSPEGTSFAATAEPSTPSLEDMAADPREGILAEGIVHMLSEEHLRHRPIDDEVSKEAFAELLKRLDGGKLFLLKDQVAELSKYEERMDDQLARGDLELARKATALLLKRREAVAKVVAKHLSAPFDFTKKERFQSDPEKLDYAASEEELSERWRRFLKLQALERLTQMQETAKALKEAGPKDEEEREAVKTPRDKIPETLEGREKKAREDMARMYDARFTRLSDLEPLDPAERFINALATVYDPHTVYLAPADKENFDIQMSGSLEGIGAVLAEDDHYIAVREVVPGGASWRQGDLEAGDIIVAVAQDGEAPVDVADMPIGKVVKLIRGPKGTVVTLTVKKPDDRVEVISITRDVVEIEEAYARGAVLDLGPDHEAMGYIHLPSFYGNTRATPGSTSERNATDDVRALLEHFQKRKMSGVIVDLRGNGGGLLGHSRDITGLLIETGPVVQTRFPDGETQVLADKDPSVSFHGEVVVLVDRFSASASEILAGALQDYDRALIVGTGPTHGKGTVQVMVDLDRLRRTQAGDPLGVLKLTIQQYFRVNGDSTQWRGVVPDVVLPDPAAHIESGERFLDHSIPWSKTDPLAFKAWSGSKWDPKTLAVKSQTRRDADPIFAKITARSAYLKTRRDDTEAPLERSAWEAKRKRDEKALEEVDPKLDEGEPRFSVKVVNYNGHKPAKGDDRHEKWQKETSRDPWLQEALYLLNDMRAP